MKSYVRQSSRLYCLLRITVYYIWYKLYLNNDFKCLLSLIDFALNEVFGNFFIILIKHIICDIAIKLTNNLCLYLINFYCLNINLVFNYSNFSIIENIIELIVCQVLNYYSIENVCKFRFKIIIKASIFIWLKNCVHLKFKPNQ